ncbi:MAG: transglycosylase SLT domain-containing protein, partial [Myxococcota bacterium]
MLRILLILLLSMVWGCKTRPREDRDVSTPLTAKTPPQTRKQALKSSKSHPKRYRLSVGAPRVVRKRKRSRVRKWRSSAPQQLFSLLDHSKMREVRGFLSEGNCIAAQQESAKTKWKSTMRRALVLRLAYCYMQRQEWMQAKSLLLPYASKPDILSDYVSFWLGQCLEKERDFKPAISSFLKVKSHSKMWIPARLEAADLLLKQRAYAQVIEILAPKLKVYGWQAVWFRALALWNKRGRKRQRMALKSMRAILVQAPMSLQAQSVKDWLKRTSVALKLSTAEKIRQSYQMNRRYAYRVSLNNLKGTSLPKRASRTLRCQWSYVQGFAWFRLRTYRKAVPWLRKAARLCRRLPYEGPRAMYRLAQAYRRQGRTTAAIRQMQRVSKAYPKHFFADDAKFAVADLYQHEKRAPLARKHYRELVRNFPKGDMVVRALWRLAYQDYRAGRWKSALARFRPLYTRYRRTKPSPAALYFSARIHQKIGRKRSKKRASDLYLRLLRQHPMHFYSFMAVEQLARLWGPWKIPEASIAQKLERAVLPNPFVIPLPKSAKVRRPSLPWRGRWSQPSEKRIQALLNKLPTPSWTKSLPYRKGVALYKVGLPELAALEWLRLVNCQMFPKSKHKSTKRKSCARHPDPGSDFLAAHFHLAGAYHLADRFYRRRGTLAGRLPFQPSTRASWYLAYPMAFWTEVKHWTQKHKIDPALAYGVMREESTFNPRTQSWSNAYGLMQLILPTARNMYRRVFRRRRVTPAMLYQPHVNIALGTRYLRMLLGMFSNHAPVAIPGYNAGPGWVRRWLKRNPTLPFDEWAETISIRQTRHYLQYVLQTYAIYRFLYGH